MKKTLSLLVWASPGFDGLAGPVPSGVKYEEIGSYDVDRLNGILTTELKEFSNYPATFAPAKYPVKLYRVTYPSVIPERQNRSTIATGLPTVQPGWGRCRGLFRSFPSRLLRDHARLRAS